MSVGVHVYGGNVAEWSERSGLVIQKVSVKCGVGVVVGVGFGVGVGVGVGFGFGFGVGIGDGVYLFF